MNPQKFRGTGVALVTPFKNYKIDFSTLENIIEYVIEGGVDYIVSLGTTGEAITLTAEECKEVFNFTVKTVNGRIPLVAGLFGSNFTQKLVNALKVYDLEGFDAIMSSSPAYNKPPQEGIYRHYMEVAKASPLPIIIYNVPGRTSSNILPETIIRLAESSDKFIAVKEASGNIGQAMSILKSRPDNFLVLCGDDPLTVPMISCGGDGVISVIANAYPTQWSEMVRAALQNDFAKAAAINSNLLDIHPWLYVEGNPAGVKAAMEHMGLCSREVRLPLAPYSEERLAGLLKEMANVSEAVESKM